MTCLCFPQFSALYPEMVDVVVLLDAFGFVPTAPVPEQMMSESLQTDFEFASLCQHAT